MCTKKNGMTCDYAPTDAVSEALRKRLHKKYETTVTVTAVDAADAASAFDTYCNVCSHDQNMERQEKGGPIFKVTITFSSSPNAGYVYYFCDQHVAQFSNGIAVGVQAAARHYYERRIAALEKKLAAHSPCGR